jgi:hypothetical protein
VAERRDKSQLVGDFLREIAVLMVVFYPLEAYFQNKFEWVSFFFVLALVSILFWRGMILEGGGE